MTFLANRHDLIRCKDLGEIRGADDRWVTNGHLLVCRTALRDVPADLPPLPAPAERVLHFDPAKPIGDWGDVVTRDGRAHWYPPTFEHKRKKRYPADPSVHFAAPKYDDEDEQPFEGVWLAGRYVEMFWPWIEESERKYQRPRGVELRSNGDLFVISVTSAAGRGYWPLAAIAPVRTL